MCVIIKTTRFYGLPLIYNQNKKNSAYYSWDIYQGKLATKFDKVSWWALWIGDPRNFYSSFFVKNYYLSALCRVLSLKTTQKTQKRCKSTKNCLAVDIAKDRNKALQKRKKNEKWQKVKQQLLQFYFFYIGILIFC